VKGDKGVKTTVGLTPNWSVAVMKPVTPEAIQPAASSAPPRCRRRTAPANRWKSMCFRRA
jgi:hypothetical protein